MEASADPGQDLCWPCHGILARERRGGGVFVDASLSGSAALALYHRHCPVASVSCNLYLFLQGQCKTGGAQGPGTEKMLRNVCGIK